MSSVQKTEDGWTIIDGVRVYIDQEGVAWDWSCARCPRCETATKVKDYNFTPMTSWLCPSCGLLYDEPVWADAESAFVTCISDDESRDDPDPGIRRLHREYHGLPPEQE